VLFIELNMKKNSFSNAVQSIVKKIPKGYVMSYKDVAYCAGYPNAFRAVGSLMKRNNNPTIPCHRVVRSNGTAGFYNAGGERRKIAKLQTEGALTKKGEMRFWMPQ
jgi:O-6-methylguanine DNA methyltransferase